MMKHKTIVKLLVLSMFALLCCTVSAQVTVQYNESSVPGKIRVTKIRNTSDGPYIVRFDGGRIISLNPGESRSGDWTVQEVKVKPQNGGAWMVIAQAKSSPQVPTSGRAPEQTTSPVLEENNVERAEVLSTNLNHPIQVQYNESSVPGKIRVTKVTNTSDEPYTVRFDGSSKNLQPGKSLSMDVTVSKVEAKPTAGGTWTMIAGQNSERN